MTKRIKISLPLCTSCLLFMLLNEDVVDIGKPDGAYSLNFVVDEYSVSFLHPAIISIKHSRSAWITNGGLSGFWYWLNYILVSSKDIFTIKKSLFSHALLCNLSLCFVLKEWRQFRQ